MASKALLRAAVVCTAFPLLLFAPGETRAQASNECHNPSATPPQQNDQGALTCSGATYAQGILHEIGDGSAFLTLTVPGSSTAMTVTAATANAGIGLNTRSTSASGNLELTVGSAGAVAITEDSTASRGIEMRQQGSGTTTADIRSGVTIGTATNPVGGSGIYLLLNRDAANRGGNEASLTNGAAIHAADQGIFVDRRSTAQTSAATTIVNTGAVSAGVGNDASTATNNLLPHGIVLNIARPDDGSSDGDAKITNSGSITVSGAYDGIRMNYNAYGDAEVDNRVGGDITAAGGRGIAFFYRNSSGTATLKNSGDITATGSGSRGIFAQTEGNGDVSIAVSGGVIKSEAEGIRATSDGTGDMTVAIAAGGTLISRRNAGLFASLGDANDNQVEIDQAGTILGRTGVYAQVAHGATAETGAQRAATDQPLIDIAWTGAFGAGTTAQTAPNDAGRFAATALDRAAVVAHRGAVVEEVTRYGQAAGIEAQIMSIGDVAAFVANGDDPRELMSQEAQIALLDGRMPGEMNADSGTEARQAAIVDQFRKLISSKDFASITDANAIDADDKDNILAWLREDSDDRRTFLRNFLQRGLSKGEEMILAALTTGGDLDALFMELPIFGDDVDAWYHADWKRDVKAFLERRNAGNIRVKVNAGAISSRGDGIRAYFTTPHDANGSIDVTVAQGATVGGGMAGVYVANAGTGLRIEKKYASPAIQNANEDLDPDDDVALPSYLNQVVRVQGTVTGGEDAAVHLVGGGALVVGGTGKLVAGSSGRAVLVNDPGPAVIYVEGEVEGGEGGRAAMDLTGGGVVTVGLTGRVRANGADSAIRGDKGTDVIIHASRHPREQQPKITRPIADMAADRGVVGLIVGAGTTTATFVEYLDGMKTGRDVTVQVKDGRPDTSGLPPASLREGGGNGGPGGNGGSEGSDSGNGTVEHMFRCHQAEDGRCRLYEALPSILLAMNAPATRDERLAAARGSNGIWTRIHLADGKSKVESSTRPDVAYDLHRNGVRAGVETAVADGLRVGGSVHGFRGVATLSGGNEAKLSSAGAGAYVTALAGGFHWDMQATATRYEADLTSAVHRRRALASDVSGTGYALSVEVGRRMAMAKFSVTPRAGIAWSRVALDDFTDLVTSTAVSVERAESLSGRIGAAMEASLGEDSRVFAALDVRHAFSIDMETVVEEEALKTATERTSVRFGLGGSFDLDDAASLRVSAGYAADGGGNRELEGGLNLTFRF